MVDSLPVNIGLPPGYTGSWSSPSSPSSPPKPEGRPIELPVLKGLFGAVIVVELFTPLFPDGAEILLPLDCGALCVWFAGGAEQLAPIPITHKYAGSSPRTVMYTIKPISNPNAICDELDIR